MKINNVKTRLKKKQEALRYIKEGLATYTRDPMALNNAGVFCARHGLYQEAYNYFREALQKLPTLSSAEQNLERVEERLTQ